MKNEVIAIRRNVAPGEVVEITERVKYDGSLTQVVARFYAGQENELTVLPFVRHKGNKIETFFTFPEGTDPYLSGEDDTLEYPLSLDIEYDDEIVVRAENKSTTYDYTLVIDIVVSYFSEPKGGAY